MSRAVSLFVCLICAAALASGCTQRQNYSESETEEFAEEVLIWAWDDTFNVKAAKLAAAHYAESHPDVRITIETKEKEEIKSNIEIMLSSNVYETLPDIILIEDYDVQEMLQAYEDEFVDLTDDVDYEQYVDYKRRLCGKDGRYYGIPFDCGTAALFYRLDLLSQAGFTEKDMENLTWERFIEIGKKVYRETGIPMLTLDPTDLPLVRLIMQSCGEWYVGEDGMTADIENNQALRQALQIHYELLESGLGMSVNGWNEFISAFQNGRVAAVVSGGWIKSNIMAIESQSGLWRVTSIPVVPENAQSVAASNVGGSAWYVLKHSQASSAAREFMLEMFTDNSEFMDELITEIGILPALENLTQFSNYQARDAFFGGQQVTKFLSGKAREIPTVNYGSKTYEIEEILEAELQNTLPDRDWELCLKHVQQRADVILKE